MNYQLLITVFTFLLLVKSHAQHIGINTNNPAFPLDVNGAINGDTLVVGSPTNHIFSLPDQSMVLQSNNNINIAAQGGPLKSRIFFRNGTTSSAVLNTFQHRLGIGVASPRASLETNGAIIIGNTTDNHSGMIRFSGSDFQGKVDTNWMSFTRPTSLIDSDMNTSIHLNEGVLDTIDYTTNDLLFKKEIANNNGTKINHYADKSAGVSQSITSSFFIDDQVWGSLRTSKVTDGFFELTGRKRVYLEGGSFEPGKSVILSIGQHINNYGAVLTEDTAPIGSARALLDVRGTTHIDELTIEDVIHLTPRTKPTSPTAGMIYMDDGSCIPCAGTVKLRYHNGTSWITL